MTPPPSTRARSPTRHGRLTLNDADSTQSEFGTGRTRTGGTSLTRETGSYPTYATSSTPGTRRTRSLRTTSSRRMDPEFRQAGMSEVWHLTLGASDLNSLKLAFGHLRKTLRTLLLSDATLTLNNLLDSHPLPSTSSPSNSTGSRYLVNTCKCPISDCPSGGL